MLLTPDSVVLLAGLVLAHAAWSALLVGAVPDRRRRGGRRGRKMLEGPEAARLVKRLYDGVAQHPKAGQLWPGWRAT